MNPSRHFHLFLLLGTLGVVACGDDNNDGPADAAGDAGDGGMIDGAATGGDAGLAADGGVTTVGLGPNELAQNAPAAKGLAVVNSDYKSVSVSLVDPTTRAVLKDPCVGSGSAAVRLSTALSGDVTLPSQPQPGNLAVVIDRTNATLTWLSAPGCEVLQQMSVAGGFKSNPHDVVVLSATKAYVTRYGTNAATNEGSDVLVVNPTAGSITKRIDFTGQATAGPTGATILPGPDRMALVDGKVYVVLNNLSADYKTEGPGRIVIIDAATDAISGAIDLPTLRNCGAISTLPAVKGLVVSCGGPPTAAPAGQLATSGLALIDLEANPPAVRVLAASLFGRAVSNGSVAPVSATRGYVVINGDFASMTPDEVWSFDAMAGSAQKVLSGMAPYTLSLHANAASQRLYVADGNDKTPRLQVFNVSNPSLFAQEGSLTTAKSGLPPRTLALH